MDSGRFETFIDAILAIMMTVMVLKIPQPEPLTLAGIWDLRIMYAAYVIIFIVLFGVWDHHRKLFTQIKVINTKVILIYSLLIYVLTLVPYFTAWVAHNPHELLPELLFGLIILTVNILFVTATQIAIKNDIYNELIEQISFKELLVTNITLFTIGTILSLAGYPISMMITCLLTVITWNIIPYIRKTGETNGN